LVKLINLVNKAEWHKTDYIKPHEYIIAEKNEELFVRVKKLLKRRGYKQLFNYTEYTYININGYKYWIVGIVLNRQKLDGGQNHGKNQ